MTGAVPIHEVKLVNIANRQEIRNWEDIPEYPDYEEIVEFDGYKHANPWDQHNRGHQ